MLKSLSRWTLLVIPGTAMLGAGIRRIGVLQRIEKATVSMLDRESKRPVSYRDNWRLREVPETRDERIARIPDRDLARAIESAREALLAMQHAEGYWCFELEADCTISAEYILMMHFMGEIDEALQAKIAVYLRDRQDTHGGWSLYPGQVYHLERAMDAQVSRSGGRNLIDIGLDDFLAEPGDHITKVRGLLANNKAEVADIETVQLRFEPTRERLLAHPDRNKVEKALGQFY